MEYFHFLIVLLALVGLIGADYHIGLVVDENDIEYTDTANTLFDGSCCDASCGDDTACCEAASCQTTFRFCFRESNHPRDDLESCPLFQLTRNNPGLVTLAEFNIAVQRYYTGGFQLYLRVSSFTGNPLTSSPDFEPPFTDPLIDNVFFEFTLPATAYEERRTANQVNQIVESVGEFGRVRIEIQTNVICVSGWNGSACEIFCADGTCTQLLTAPTSTFPTASQGSVAPSPGGDNGDVVGIAVGVSIGVLALILLVVVVIAVACVMMRRSKNTASYTIKRRTQKVESQPTTNDHVPQTSSHLYAVVNKDKKTRPPSDVSGSGGESDCEVPPSLPRYAPEDPPAYTTTEEYQPMDGGGGIYTNVLHHEVQDDSL